MQKQKTFHIRQKGMELLEKALFKLINAYDLYCDCRRDNKISDVKTLEDYCDSLKHLLNAHSQVLRTALDVQCILSDVVRLYVVIPEDEEVVA